MIAAGNNACLDCFSHPMRWSSLGWTCPRCGTTYKHELKTENRREAAVALAKSEWDTERASYDMRTVRWVDAPRPLQDRYVREMDAVLKTLTNCGWRITRC